MSLVDWLGRGSVTVILMLHEGISRDMEKEEEAGEEAALHMIGGGGRVHGRERTGGIDLGASLQRDTEVEASHLLDPGQLLVVTK